MSRKETTLGEARVGVSFNPSGNATVDEIKARASELIDLLDALPAEEAEVARLKAVAMTEVEGAAHWAVKAAVRADQAAKRAGSGSGSRK